MVRKNFKHAPALARVLRVLRAFFEIPYRGLEQLEAIREGCAQVVHPETGFRNPAGAPVCLSGVSLIAVAIFASSTVYAANDFFDWDEPENCPSRIELQREWERLRGEKPIGAHSLKFKARASQVENGLWTLKLETWRTKPEPLALGERTLRGASCKDVLDAAVIIASIAMAEELERARPKKRKRGSQAKKTDARMSFVIDSSTVSTSTLASESTLTAASAPDSALVDAPAPPATPRPLFAPITESTLPIDSATAPTRWFLMAGASTGLASMPAPNIGAHILAAFELAPLRIEAALVQFLESTAFFGNTERGGAIGMTTGSLSACFVFGGRTATGFDPSLCAGAEVAALTGRGVGVTDPGEADLLRVSGLVSAPLHFHLAPPIILRISPVLFWSASKTEFVLDNLGTVFEPALVSVRMDVGVGMRFE